jgi:hypothetical protein
VPQAEVSPGGGREQRAVFAAVRSACGCCARRVLTAAHARPHLACSAWTRAWWSCRRCWSRSRRHCQRRCPTCLSCGASWRTRCMREPAACARAWLCGCAVCVCVLPRLFLRMVQCPTRLRVARQTHQHTHQHIRTNTHTHTPRVHPVCVCVCAAGGYQPRAGPGEGRAAGQVGAPDRAEVNAGQGACERVRARCVSVWAVARRLCWGPRHTPHRTATHCRMWSRCLHRTTS